MAKDRPRSAGIVLYRLDPFEVLIAHPGGPLWAKKNEGAWSIPKGLVDADEDDETAALREFFEETGLALDPETMVDLGSIRLRSGKEVTAWGVQGDFEPGSLRSNPVRMQWPPRSGNTIEFPEIDVVRWCRPEEARMLLNPAQTAFLDRLQEFLDHGK